MDLTDKSIVKDDGTAMSFSEFWGDAQAEAPDSLGNKFLNLFSGNVDRARDIYNSKYAQWDARQKAQADYEYTRLLNQTKYQDEVKALRDAGLNPYAILAGNGMSAGNMSYSSAQTTGYQSAKVKENSNLGKAATALAIIIGAVIKAVI